MKKIIGIILLITIFVILIGATCIVCGWKYGLVAWAVGFVIALIICIAIFLIEDDK